MHKVKTALITFIITFFVTWIGCLCLFDYYRMDLCNFEAETLILESEESPSPIEAINLNV